MALGRWSSVRLVLVLVIACAGCWERHDVSVTADAGHKLGYVGPSQIPTAPTSGTTVLTDTSGALSWAASGSGLSGLTQYGTLVAASSTSAATVGPGSAAQIYLWQGTSSNPAWETLSQDVSITASGVASLLKGTAMTGNLTWTPAPSTARFLQMGSPTSDVNPGASLQIVAASAYASASTNTTGTPLYLSAGNSQNGTAGASIQLSGGHNSAGLTTTAWYSDYTLLDSVAGTPGIGFSLTGTPTILPWATNVGTLGTTSNYWGNIYSTNHVLSGPAAHSVLIGEATANIVGVGPSSASGTPLVANGGSADPLFQSLNLASSNAVGSSILPVGNGGTGVANPSANSLMIAEGSSPMHLLTLPANEFVIGTAGDPVNTVALKWNDSTGVMQMTTATAPTSVPSTGAYLYAPTGALETYSQAGTIEGLGASLTGTVDVGQPQMLVHRLADSVITISDTSSHLVWTSPTINSTKNTSLGLRITTLERDTTALNPPQFAEHICAASVSGTVWKTSGCTLINDVYVSWQPSYSISSTGSGSSQSLTLYLSDNQSGGLVMDFQIHIEYFLN